MENGNGIAKNGNGNGNGVIAKNGNGKKKRSVIKVVLVVIGLVVLLGAGAVAGSLYTKAQSNAGDNTAQETNALVNTVGKLMALATDETPSIATVTDKEKLKEQPFFAKSENGDKVLIYTKDKKAILYRPSTNKIIEVMPISFNDNSAAAPAATTPTTPAKK